VASRDHNGDEQPSRIGYFAAIFVSALGHAALFATVFFIAPRFLHPEEAAPPAYTVKIVDNIPAGDLGTHLPRINRRPADEAKAAAPKPEESKVKTEPPKTELALNDDKNALKINAKATDAPTATPTPEPTIEATPEPKNCRAHDRADDCANAAAHSGADETREAKAHAQQGVAQPAQV